MNPQTPFEDRLLTQLKHAVDERPDRSPGRRKLLAGGGAVLVAGLGIGIPVLTAGTASAFEITQDGESLRIEVKELSDAGGLEEALAEYGIKADVTYLPLGKECARGRYTPYKGGEGEMRNDIGGTGMSQMDGEFTSFTLELMPEFNRDKTLVIEIAPLDDFDSDDEWIPGGERVGVAVGEVADCEVQDQPPVPTSDMTLLEHPPTDDED